MSQALFLSITCTVYRLLQELETSESSVKADLDRVQQMLQSETDSLRAQVSVSVGLNNCDHMLNQPSLLQ